MNVLVSHEYVIYVNATTQMMMDNMDIWVSSKQMCIVAIVCD